MKRAQFRSVRVHHGDSEYVAICRVIPAKRPAHVSADSPQFMKPGRQAQVQVLRILRDAIDVTSDLTWFARRAIEDEARRLGGASGD